MIETAPSPAVAEAVTGYFAMWNEREPGRRRAVIERTWSPRASYTEPLLATQGYDDLDAGIAQMQGQFEGFSLRLVGPIQSHHDRVRWSWELVGPDGQASLARGTNVGTMAPDGRLAEVTGFFDHTDGITHSPV